MAAYPTYPVSSQDWILRTAIQKKRDEPENGKREKWLLSHWFVWLKTVAGGVTHGA